MMATSASAVFNASICQPWTSARTHQCTAPGLRSSLCPSLHRSSAVGSAFTVSGQFKGPFRQPSGSGASQLGRQVSPRCGMQDAQRLVERKVVKMMRPDGLLSALSEEGGYKLLDVRPTWEHERAHVGGGALHVPLFIEDTGSGAESFIRKSAVSGYGTFWMGFRSTIPNDLFVEQVERIAKKEERLILACGDGLRSLLATEVLHKNGFVNIAWLADGFSKCSDQDLPKVVGETELRFAHIGGAAYFLVKGLQMVGALKGVSRVAAPRT